MGIHSVAILRFGVFELDLKTGELRKSGVLINLPPQPFKILVLLASRPGQLVTREDIQKEIWGNETFVDFEKGLNFAIRKIRAALNDDAEIPRYIETLPRRGYRFIAPMEATDPIHAALSPRKAIDESAHPDFWTAPVVPEPSSQSLTVKRSRLVLWVSGSLLLVGIVLAGLLVFNWTSHGAIRSLAVLPLENLSGNPEQEYFADGITDELITELARIQELRVISRTSAMIYKRAGKPLSQIAGELGVDAVVEGTVSRSDNRIRIRIQLIRIKPEEHLWTEIYESDLGDVLTVQSEVAKAIAGKIRIKITPEEQAQLSRIRRVNPEAFNAYLMGRHQWEKREAKALKSSIDYFKTALDNDPSYAPAWAGLADSYDVLNDYDLSAPQESYPKARAAAEEALKLDETLGEAHATLASVKAEYEWDWSGAEKEFKRAFELRPKYATAHQWYSEYLLRAGHFDQALEEIRRAYDLDPLSPIINAEMGGDLYFVRQYDEAIQRLRRSLEAEPGLGYVHSWLGFAYVKKGMMQEAIAEFKIAITMSGGSLSFKANLGYAFGASEMKREAQAIAKELTARSEQNYVSPYAIALVYVGLGDLDKTFQYLEKAYAEHDPGLNLIAIDPALDNLRSNPHFTDLQKRVGLPR